MVGQLSREGTWGRRPRLWRPAALRSLGTDHLYFFLVPPGYLCSGFLLHAPSFPQPCTPHSSPALQPAGLPLQLELISQHKKDNTDSCSQHHSLPDAPWCSWGRGHWGPPSCQP